MNPSSFLLFCAVLILFGCSSEKSKSNNPPTIASSDNYQAAGIVSKTLPEIIEALDQRQLTSEALVQLYLERITAIDSNGPKLQSVLSINPNAIDEAKALDQLRLKGQLKGPLHGIPILLKDNIESMDKLATTAGALALKDNVTGRDSPLVAGLRAQGAIILGKTNLSQWANFRSENSLSGWSALGGQVRNPHMLDRNPCGSSSGSGAATAASLAAASVGTETNGSVICPSNANGIVGFKPTVGIIPQKYIIPISATQDTAGPMTKSVMGAAIMMNAMATNTPDIDYTANLNKRSLAGVKIGVLDFAKGQSTDILSLFEQALTDLEQAGAILVPIRQKPDTPDNYGQMAYDILKYEFKDGLNTYLASTDPKKVKVRDLEQLIAFNLEHHALELALFDQGILIDSQAMAPLHSEEYKIAVAMVREATQTQGIDLLLNQYGVSVLIAPSGPVVPRIDPINGDVWPNDWPGFGSHAARAGYPHVTVPMGAVHSLSVGLSFIGTKNSDAEVLGYAFAYEQHSMRRIEPQYLPSAASLPSISRAMDSPSSNSL